MMSAVRKSGMLAVFVLVGAYGVGALRGPHGLAALSEKREQIRKLQEENAELEAANQKKRDRIRILSSSREAQQQEIREKLKLLRPGEKQIILPKPRVED
ncbi:MAG TPA: septum formation initiator family protein [Bryobacteraceae bacterium]|nr:septum formation initiator family protein [Bryobacteraceae bacterium]